MLRDSTSPRQFGFKELWRKVPKPAAFWTPRYIAARTRVLVHERLQPDDPWLTHDMVAFLSEWLKPTDVVVEFGSGRSTLWFARRVARVISIEHHEGWCKTVSGRLREQGLPQATCTLAEDHPTAYPQAAERQLEGRADLILVDGQQRDACAVWALSRVRPGGLIVIDNVNWYLPHRTHSPTSVGELGQPVSPLWETFCERTAGWRRFWTSNHVTDTVAFFAPAQV